MTAESTPRLLHLGCGLIAPAEWMNVDGSWGAWFAQHTGLRKLLQTIRVLPRSVEETPWPTNIVIADMRKPLKYPDGTFDGCYSSHLIEHLFRNDALVVLREMRRVLKPGAPCRTLVPDLRAMVDEYLGVRALGSWYSDKMPKEDDPARRFMIRLHARLEAGPRGWRQKLYSGFGDFQTHKWMYDAPSLVKLMTEAGFCECREMGLHESAIPHIDKVEMPGRVNDGTGVVVEGIKPR